MTVHRDITILCFNTIYANKIDCLLPLCERLRRKRRRRGEREVGRRGERKREREHE